MSPKAALTLASALTAAVLVVIAYVGIGAMSGIAWSQWPSNARTALGIAPAAAMTAGLAAWLIVGWREGADLDRKWSPMGMAVKTVALAFLMFPVFVLLCLAIAEVFDQMFAASPGTFREAWVWMPPIALYAVIFGVVLGALPALAAEFFLCRRYLRLTTTKWGG